MASMTPFIKDLGDHLRRAFAAVTQRPLQWSQIDALATLEEKEEAQRREQAEESQPDIKLQNDRDI